ncbi:ABC transporter permease [uncultured Tenacibaculum sp.]|uniref:ABC transporter permease n=1 Tax=uncultured Tenacibaculum sp. TaxID=174713 RepID=UPI00260AC6C2|nr:ABC transporter permease [uncultured Tenacibaculum sp.]
MSALSFYISNTKNELIKLKRTFAFWLTIISALSIPLLFFIVYAVKHAKLIPEVGVNPWEKFMVNQVKNSIPFFVPMFIVLITSLIIQVEHKASGIKHIFTLPVPKWSVYFGKLSIVLLSILITYVYFYLAILFFGVLLGAFYPDLGFLDFQPEFFKYIKMLFLSFIASLGIVGIQFWLSFRVKNFIVPLAVGMVLVIVGLIASQAPESIYFPYAYNLLSINLGDKAPLTFGYSSVLVYSVFCFIVTCILGYFDIRRLNIK